jgi:hypothetical protein
MRVELTIALISISFILTLVIGHLSLHFVRVENEARLRDDLCSKLFDLVHSDAFLENRTCQLVPATVLCPVLPFFTFFVQFGSREEQFLRGHFANINVDQL